MLVSFYAEQALEEGHKATDGTLPHPEADLDASMAYIEREKCREKCSVRDPKNARLNPDTDRQGAREQNCDRRSKMETVSALRPSSKSDRCQKSIATPGDRSRDFHVLIEVSWTRTEKFQRGAVQN